jgi:CDP-diacylglycerol--serine O-phosphatidyltransferase
MRKGIYLLPNSLTLCGMFAGFYAIISVLKGNYVHAAWAVLIAGVFDGLDGWVARLTHSTTKFGIELDSLSDEIAFGIAPAALLYKWSLMPFGRVGWAAAFLFAACGALRLARYNVQMGSTERKSFTGMPIPAAAGFVAAMVLFYSEMGMDHTKSVFILVITFLLSILMVSTLRFHGAKEIDFSKRKPFWLLVAVAVTFAIVVMHPEIALFVFAVIYLIGGLIENSYLLLRKGKQAGKAS